jgi:hypothetical protein
LPSSLLWFLFLPFSFSRRAVAPSRPVFDHFLRATIGVAAIIAGFYTRRPNYPDWSAAINYRPAVLILTAIFLLGGKVRWRRGLATVPVYRRTGDGRPDSGTVARPPGGLFAPWRRSRRP